jgi:hypothetical protein
MSALQNEACIVGIGQTPFLRGTDDDCSSKQIWGQSKNYPYPTTLMLSFLNDLNA